jgi:hypothetical protein
MILARGSVAAVNFVFDRTIEQWMGSKRACESPIAEACPFRPQQQARSSSRGGPRMRIPLCCASVGRKLLKGRNSNPDGVEADYDLPGVS